MDHKRKLFCALFQLVTREEQNAPGFYYLVKWRRHGHDQPEDDFREKAIRAHINTLTCEDEPIYKEYEIYVLAINEVGEAVSPPRMVLGFSGEDGKCVHAVIHVIYKEYEIYVLAINEVGEAVSPPRMVLGFSGEDGKCMHAVTRTSQVLI